MRCVRASVLLCLFALAACGRNSESASPGGEPAAGGAASAAREPSGESYRNIDVASPVVKAAAEFAVGEQARITGATLKLGAIKSAQQQAAAGITNFLLCLDYSQDAGGDQATAVVLRNAQGQHTLTSWTIAPCE